MEAQQERMEAMLTRYTASQPDREYQPHQVHILGPVRALRRKALRSSERATADAPSFPRLRSWRRAWRTTTSATSAFRC